MHLSFKKLALASALACAFTAASAADVQIYGKVDVGLAFTSVDNGIDSSRENNLSMLSGQTAGSRVGLRGTEDLGNGYKVGFILETGFNPDSGTLGQGSRLFGREAEVHVQGGFGTLKFGRMGALASGFPDTGLFGGNMSPFAVCYGEVPGHRFIFAGDFSPLDNAITYISPDFAGWKIHLQYSMDRNVQSNGVLNEDQTWSHGVEGKTTVDRFYAAALSYRNDRMEFNTVVDSTNYAHDTLTETRPDDSFVWSTGLRYAFNPVTLYVGGQYFKDARDFLVPEYQGGKWLSNSLYAKDGFGLHIGADIAYGPGMFKVFTGYMKAEGSTDGQQELKRYVASFGYWWNLSKRTAIYADVGYTRDDLADKNPVYQVEYGTADAYSAGLGIVTNF